MRCFCHRRVLRLPCSLGTGASGRCIPRRASGRRRIDGCAQLVGGGCITDRLSSDSSVSSAVASEHRFWDKQNVALFTASAALSATDFAVTRANLQSGGRELNPVVRLFGRSTAGAGNELYRRNRGRGWLELLLPQDRPPQAGADRIAEEHRKFGRSRELRASPPVIQAQAFLCKRRFDVRHFSRGIRTMGCLPLPGCPLPPPPVYSNHRVSAKSRNNL